MDIPKGYLEYPFYFTYIHGFQKEQFPLLSQLDRNVVIYGQKMEVKIQKPWYKTSFLLPVAVEMCCIIRFHVLKELFFKTFWPRWIRAFPNSSDDMQLIEFCSNCCSLVTDTKLCTAESIYRCHREKTRKKNVSYSEVNSFIPY